MSNWQDRFAHSSPAPATASDPLLHATLEHYERHALQFWEGTKDHDVSQNYQHFLAALAPGSQRILDLGCGPGRDLLYFKSRGHQPMGLDGCRQFVEMARSYAGCPVLHQDFRALDLSAHTFDGIFANAALFHVPRQDLAEVLTTLQKALVPGGILFSSNPRGDGESWDGSRYANYMQYPEYAARLADAGLVILEHYYRPAGKPREQQPWLAVVSQKPHSGA